MAHNLKEWRGRIACLSGHRRNLSAYLDGELDRSLLASLEEHLSACPHCRARLEELRLTSRALSHLIVPPARVPAWQAASLQRRERPASGAALERFWRTKIELPAPLVAASALALVFAATALLLMGQRSSSAPSVELPPASAVAPQIKIIEVPVERERVITRTVYASASRAPSRSAQTAQPGLTLSRQQQQRPVMIAERAERERRAGRSDGQFLTAPSLAGFRPAPDANLRIVKEPEQ